MQEIKAIETHYKGYRFRSRLEARWAVFFDSVGVKYEYEKEGFDLGKAGKYLPDFYLPTIDAWFEVKPMYPTPIEVQKAQALNDLTGKAVIISVDSFSNPKIPPLCKIYCTDMSDSSGGLYENYGVFWFAESGMIRFVVMDSRDRTFYGSSDFTNHIDWIDSDTEEGIASGSIYKCPELVKRARSARFEHGE